MFTGLIETTGTLRRVEARSAGVTVTIGAPRSLVAALSLGESVACDGACLTVTRFGDDAFTVDASAETLARTTLGDRRPGDPLHLERALRLGDRLGGHIVAGHVDATGAVAAKSRLGEALRLDVSVPPSLLRYLVEKGSVAIDGVSLTVNTVDDAAGTFSVVLIPHTQGVVTLHQRAVGARVNLEVDVLGKYVERLLGRGPREAAEPGHGAGSGAGHGAGSGAGHGAGHSIDLERLARAGFLGR